MHIDQCKLPNKKLFKINILLILELLLFLTPHSFFSRYHEYNLIFVPKNKHFCAYYNKKRAHAYRHLF